MKWVEKWKKCLKFCKIVIMWKIFAHKNIWIIAFAWEWEATWKAKEKKVIDAEQDNWDIQFINAIIYFSCQEVFTLQPVFQRRKLSYFTDSQHQKISSL